MRKLKFLFYFIFLCNCVFSQGLIEYSNIWKDGIMFPAKEFKRLGVKAVKYTEMNREKKWGRSSMSIFDKNGFLRFENSWDSTFIIGGELISVSFLDNGGRKVIRKIVSSDYLKISEQLPEDLFWSTYLNAKFDISKNKQHDTLEIESYLQWAEDSCIFYRQYVNNQILDSGKTESMRIIPLEEGKDIYRCKTIVQRKNENSRDSTIWCKATSANSDPESSMQYIYSFSDGKIYTVSTKLYKKGKVSESSIQYYKYDNKGKLSSIESKNEKNIITSRIIYDYSGKGNRTTVKEEYYYGKLNSKTYINDEEKILLKLYPASIETRQDIKICYSYYDNGLIKSVEKWYGETSFIEENYTYTYFD